MRYIQYSRRVRRYDILDITREIIDSDAPYKLTEKGYTWNML